MSSGADDEDAQTTSKELSALRARLYTSGSTPADRAAYDAAPARDPIVLAGRAEGPHNPQDRQDAVGTATAAAPLALTRHFWQIRPFTAGVLAVTLLVLGAGIGAGIGSMTRESAQPTTQSAGPRSSSVGSAPSLPTPVAARTLPMRASIRRSTISALTKILASSTNDTAVNRALQTIGKDISNPATDGARMNRYACSNSTGIVRTSTRGRPIVLTLQNSPLSLPAQSHFRIKTYLTRFASWSWVLSAARGTTGSAPVAVGAGSPEAGAVQYAEFDATGIGNLTRVEVSSPGNAPFLWQLDSCTTGT